MIRVLILYLPRMICSAWNLSPLYFGLVFVTKDSMGILYRTTRDLSESLFREISSASASPTIRPTIGKCTVWLFGYGPARLFVVMAIVRTMRCKV